MGAEDLHHCDDDQAGGEVAGQSGDQGAPFLVLLLFKLNPEKVLLSSSFNPLSAFPSHNGFIIWDEFLGLHRGHIASI